MSSDAGKKRVLVIAGVWLVLLTCAGYFVKRIWFPAKKEQLLSETGSSTQYRENITGYADAFSGYSIIRSDRFHGLMKQAGIKVNVEDDKADCTARAKALRDGDIQWAVFTIDSFIKACVDINELPGTIALIIDETKGADAIVATKSVLGNISDLDNPNARIVLTRNSPSEFLSRVVISEFNLPSLPTQWWKEAYGAEDVYRQLRADRGQYPYAYALWEPYVSKALEDPNNHVLLGSENLSGRIVDVIVFERRFLLNHSDTARAFVECYLRAAYSYGKGDGMVQLIMEDDKSLNQKQAQQIVNGIIWKTTIENYAHFGLQGGGLPHVEDMIIDITNILVQTNAIPVNNPITGNESKLFYDDILVGLQSDGFHPAKKSNMLGNVGLAVDLGKIRGQEELPSLSDSEWNNLIAVGSIKTNPIQFGRGTAGITHRSERELRDIADRMISLPEYYLLVVGQASAKGDVDKNKKLAEQRAEAVVGFLQKLGMSKTRLKARASEPTVNSNSSVSFVVGQRPY